MSPSIGLLYLAGSELSKRNEAVLAAVGTPQAPRLLVQPAGSAVTQRRSRRWTMLRSTKRHWLRRAALAVIWAGVWAPMADLAAIAAEVPAPGQSRTIDAIKSRGSIRVGINVALPWLGQSPSTREFFGPAMEIGNEIAKQLGVPLSMSTAASDVIIAGLQANQYDLALAPLFATPRRMEVVDFSIGPSPASAMRCSTTARSDRLRIWIART